MMTPEMSSKLRRSLILHEGYSNFPYPDPLNPEIITIGIGYNLTARGIDEEWINTQYLKDVEYFYKQLCGFPWYQKLNTDRQIVLIDMAFMGWKKFLSFKKMIAALEVGDYETAANEMLNSKWAAQVKTRAIDLYQAMMTGVYNVKGDIS